MNSLFLGNFKAAFHGKWIEFRDFREYTSEQDAKHIDWMRSSSEGTTIMRRYREEKQWNILCLVDRRETLWYQDGPEKENILQNIIRLIGEASLSAGESFGGFIVHAWWTEKVKIKKQKTVLFEMQKSSYDGRDISEPLECNCLLSKNLRRSIVFILSDSRDIERDSLRQAAKKHDIIFVHVSSHFESDLSWEGVMFLEGNTWGAAINLGNAKKREKYKQLREEELQKFKWELRSIWVDSIFVDSVESIFPKFLACMKIRSNR